MLGLDRPRLVLSAGLMLGLGIASMPSGVSSAAEATDGRLFVVVAPRAESGPVGVIAFDLSADGLPVQAETYETGGLGNARAAPQEGIVDPPGRFLLVPNQESHDITVFSVGAGLRLTEVDGSPFESIRRPIDGVFHPSGEWVYVSASIQRVGVYRIDAQGRLELQQTVPLSSPRDIEIRPDGRFLYVADGFLGLRAYSVSAFGDLEELGGSPFLFNASRPFEIEISSDGRWLFLLDLDLGLFVFELGADGVPDLLAGSPYGLTEFSTALRLTDDDAFLYAAASQPRIRAFTVAPDGSLTTIPGSPFPGEFVTPELLQPPGTSRLYQVAREQRRVTLHSIAPSGALTKTDTVTVADERVPLGAAFLVQPPDGNSPPIADAGVDEQAECATPNGAVVSLDGSGSGDPDSTPGTNDDIASFEWFEDFGLPSQIALGQGELLDVTLPLGPHVITLRVTDFAGATDTDEVVKTVIDTTPPQLAVDLDPQTLWPPNHRLILVTAEVAAADACGTPSIELTSVVSSEPDDAPGAGDGSTTADIQGAELGTADLDFELRAERAGSGSGRTYTVEYAARDASGNSASASAQAFVPHDRGGRTDPVELSAEQTEAGTLLAWGAVEDALYYNVVRGELSRIVPTHEAYDLGQVRCVEAQSTDESSLGWEDASVPPAGQAFFYLVEYSDGARSSYGAESAAKPRVVTSGDCE